MSDDSKSLGLEEPITRRDFLNGASAAIGSLVAAQSTTPGNPDWDGYGGVGEYRTAHGNTWDVVQAAHGIRDGRYGVASGLKAGDTGELYDLVIVGGGSAGLGSAYCFHQHYPSGLKCLILENHSIFGGEAKQNEFFVNGQRLIAPQGPWRMVPEPNGKGGWMNDFYRDIGLNAGQFRYQEWDAKFTSLEFDRALDFSLLLPPKVASFGYFFGGKESYWVRDLWRGGLEQSPWLPEVRRDLREAVFGTRRPSEGKADLPKAEFERWLDSISYQQYLERYMSLHPEVTRFVHPMPACIFGLGADATTALNAYNVKFPGFHGITPGPFNGDITEHYLETHHSFPGGNSNTLRHMVKYLIPDAVPGPATLDNIHNHPIRIEALDREENATRIRLRSTVMRVEHLGKPENAGHVQITYLRDGKLCSLRARKVVMASGGWVNRHIMPDLPEKNRKAYEQYHHSSTLVANVALTNWRFLYKLGLTGGRWFDGLGYAACIRKQMVIGDYRPALDPDAPNVLSLYIPFYEPGKPIAEQVSRGRAKLFGTSFASYERQIRELLAGMFSRSGFDPKRDIAGIVLNRWGHSLAVPEPGFVLGKNGSPPYRTLAREPFGRVAFAHSEFESGQSFGGAMNQARLASQELAAFV